MTLLRRVGRLWKEDDQTAHVYFDFNIATPSRPSGDDVLNEMVDDAFSEAANDLAAGCHSHKSRNHNEIQNHVPKQRRSLAFEQKIF